jgi:hypothetical protein
MVKTNAEIQRDYRNRRAMAGENGDRRLNIWITTGAAMALQRLAKKSGKTKREMLECLLIDADEAAQHNMEEDSVEYNEYFKITA